MKTKCARRKTVFFLLSLNAALILATPVFSAVRPAMNFRIVRGEEEPAKKNKSKTKNFSYRNNTSVKIYSDPIRKMMHVIAKANKNKEIDFFLFDMDGTLLRNYKLKAKEHIKNSGVEKRFLHLSCFQR